jgi:hypothetical protein
MNLDVSKSNVGLRRPISCYTKVQAIVSAIIRNRVVFCKQKGVIVEKCGDTARMLAASEN